MLRPTTNSPLTRSRTKTLASLSTRSTPPEVVVHSVGSCLSFHSLDWDKVADADDCICSAPGPRSAVDDDFFSLHDFHVQVDEGEFEMSKVSYAF